MTNADNSSESKPVVDEKLRAEAVAKLTLLLDADDPETAHGDADDVLCVLLTALGYDKVVEVYDRVEKWYA